MNETDWKSTACSGCHNGIRYGVEQPDECWECDGSGQLWVHRSGMLAIYPGGPARGSWKQEAARLFAERGEAAS